MGTLDLVIAIFTLVACLALIIDCAIIVLSKQQVAYAARVGAKYAADNDTEGSGTSVGAGLEGARVAKETLKRIAPLLSTVSTQYQRHQRSYGSASAINTLSYYEVSVSAECKLPGSDILPGFSKLSETAIAYVHETPLLAVRGNGAPAQGDPYSQPAPDRTLWLPIVRPNGNAGKHFIYKEVVDSELCPHPGRTYIQVGSGMRGNRGLPFPMFVYYNKDIPVSVKDPR